MKKSIKIWLIILCSLLGLGFVFSVVGAVMGGRLYNAARLVWGSRIENIVKYSQMKGDYYWRGWWDHDYPDYDDFKNYREEQAQYWQDQSEYWKEHRDEWREDAKDRWEREWDRYGEHNRGEHCRSNYRPAQFTTNARRENRNSCHTNRYGAGSCGGRNWQNSQRWENGGHCGQESCLRDGWCEDGSCLQNGLCENGSSCRNVPRFQVNTGNGLVY